VQVKIAVVGTGHVGLVTAVAMATLGHDVVGMDSDAEKITALQAGVSPFFEPGLEEALGQVLERGNLCFTHSMQEALEEAEVVFICVGTPPGEDGGPNLVAIEVVAREVAQHGRDGVVLVAKSTVPAGTAEWVQLTLSRENPVGRFEVASNPEFLREGSALSDSLRPDRILVGADSEEAFRALRRVYEPITDQGTPLYETDILTAELAKHACNAYLALKISYVNGLARLCERVGANVVDVAAVMGADPRIGRSFLDAGLGYGGSCLPKDLSAFRRFAESFDYEFGLLGEVERINDQAIVAAADKIQAALGNLQGRRVAILGLAFKPGTDDVRFAPAVALARLLLEAGADVVGYDPQAAANAKEELPEIELASDPYGAASGAHCLVVATEWEEFRSLDVSELRAVMASPVVVDCRNVFSPAVMKAAGFTYFPTGAPPVTLA
jgi:UDPglucose 6-dehydrogenase